MATLRKSELQYLCKALEIEVSGGRVADFVDALRCAIQKGRRTSQAPQRLLR